MAAEKDTLPRIDATTVPQPTTGPLSFEELQLAARNRGIPLEALRYDLTPTGLHYLLVHFDIPCIDPAAWRLRVGGNVKKEFALTLDELRQRPRRSLAVTFECAGNGRARLSPRPISQPWLNEAVSTAEWTGTPLAGLLDEAGLAPGTVELVFTGADHGVEKGYEQDYGRSLSVADATRPDVLLAYEMNGRSLEPQHGFPVRLLVPGWYGMTQVKWLSRIEAVTVPFDGYQQRVAYFYRRDAEDPGEPVTRMRPRALLLPPGFPDFLTRRRTLDAGRVTVRGRAWSGYGPISRVQFAVDNRWVDAALETPASPFAWCAWSAAWDATPGEHVLSCRATDSAGNRQPVEPPWNLQGMGNNLAQEVPVTVRRPVLLPLDSIKPPA
jgi:DMSO/TMAO reductase YedYZ molybdopterin-dependent catalytic subunit